MKKQLIIGMTVLIAGLSYQPVMAAGAAKPSVREALVDYAAQVKKSAFGNSRSSKGLEAQKIQAAQEKIIAELKLSEGKSSSIAMALTGSKSTQRLDSLATIVAAKRLSAEVSKGDAAEGRSIELAADAAAKIIANSALVGARTTAKDLSATEMKEVSTALEKLETLPEAILTRFEQRERDSYTEIVNKYDLLLDSGKMGAEEAFVKAIMEVKSVDKAKALEVVKKLKDCV